jgi:phytanoyl-CoA hydroxylase
MHISAAIKQFGMKQSGEQMLSDSEFEQYQDKGYVLTDVLANGEVEAAKTRLQEYVTGQRETGDLAMQLEPHVEQGEVEVEDEAKAYRKISGLVKHDELFYELATKPAILEPMKQLLGPHLKMYWSGAMMKPPQVGSEKGPHQDLPYWPIQFQGECSVWIPLDEATPDNGCMQVIPGAHKRGQLPHVSVENDFIIEDDQYEESQFQSVPMEPGEGLFFYGLLPHFTRSNQTTDWRRAIVFAYTSSRSRYTADSDLPDCVHVSGKSFPGCI